MALAKVCLFRNLRLFLLSVRSNLS